MISEQSLRARLSILASFRGRSRVLHLTTLAFFVSFVVWFDMAPFVVAIQRDLGLSQAQMVTLSLCNLALTVPARVFVGALLDRFGPRRLYGLLLMFAAIPNTLFATSHSYGMLVASRLLLGIVGAGFVVGIRMVSEWFPPEDLGTAEGVYGGWGNFGSAGAALLLPGLATAVAGGAGAWRWGVGVAGAVSAIYGAIYLVSVRDTPPGVTYVRPRRRGALPVGSRGAVVALAALQLPITGILVVVLVRIHDAGVLSVRAVWLVMPVLAALLAWQLTSVVRVNRPVLRGEAPDHAYPFMPVALLSLAYAVTFGAELAVVSLLPTFFATTFGLKIAAAGAAGSAFAFTNLVTRPGGGVLSDMVRSRRRVVVGALVGTAATFVLLSLLSPSWPVAVGIGAVALASIFVQGGNGAVFAMVPQIHRPVGGQIAGLAGSYGNIGGIAFSSVLFFTANDAHALFLVVAAASAVVAILCRWLPDVDAHAEVLLLDSTKAA
jgi:NNP family nitrate/nitrite transporter-like MFS transporter